MFFCKRVLFVFRSIDILHLTLPTTSLWRCENSVNKFVKSHLPQSRKGRPQFNEFSIIALEDDVIFLSRNSIEFVYTVDLGFL